MTAREVLLIAVGYALGAVPVGYVLARWCTGIDLRRCGSGNVGATNVLRTTTAPLALAVLVLDVAKGAAAVALAVLAGASEAVRVASGFAAIVGHVHPVWLGFRGGKGVATACGAFALLAPAETLAASIVFVAVVAASRYVSLGSLLATLCLAASLWIRHGAVATTVGAVCAAGLVVVAHRDNVVRLVRGAERRMGEHV